MPTIQSTTRASVAIAALFMIAACGDNKPNDNAMASQAATDAAARDLAMASADSNAKPFAVAVAVKGYDADRCGNHAQIRIERQGVQQREQSRRHVYRGIGE